MNLLCNHVVILLLFSFNYVLSEESANSTSNSTIEVDLLKDKTIAITPNKLQLEVNQKSRIVLTLSKKISHPIKLIFVCNDNEVNLTELLVIKSLPIESQCDTIGLSLPNPFTLRPFQSEVEIEVTGLKPGSNRILAIHSTSDFVNCHESFVQISVGQSRYISIISVAVGWMYFAAWTISFYPQLWMNYKRKCVIGLDFDLIGLNIISFICITTYYCCLYFSSFFQSQYYHQYNHSSIPVAINDVVFILHADWAILLVVITMIIYERGDQKLSLGFNILSVAFVAAAVVLMAIAAFGILTWLTSISYFSYVSFAVTIIKYAPQAWLNYKRQSTVGWAVGGVLLDLSGGALSILQMLLLAYNYSDWISLFSNFTKFGVGLVSVFFDVIFLLQHFVLYRYSRDDTDNLKGLMALTPRQSICIDLKQLEAFSRSNSKFNSPINSQFNSRRNTLISSPIASRINSRRNTLLTSPLNRQNSLMPTAFGKTICNLNDRRNTMIASRQNTPNASRLNIRRNTGNLKSFREISFGNAVVARL